MLCTRIRLSDRRFRVISSVGPQMPLVTDSTVFTSATKTATRAEAETAQSMASTTAIKNTRGPFVRPCTISNTIDACSSSTTVEHAATISSASVDSSVEISAAAADGPVTLTMESTPRSVRDLRRYVPHFTSPTCEFLTWTFLMRS